jgi:hypothetical protein
LEGKIGLHAGFVVHLSCWVKDALSMRFQYAFIHEITGFEGARDFINESGIMPHQKL